jgi:membrane metallo-endopeptidase-like protein 1
MWISNNPDADEQLPGINLTGKQLFFLNFAQVNLFVLVCKHKLYCILQVWCGKQRIDAVKSRLKIAVHSPGIFR